MPLLAFAFLTQNFSTPKAPTLLYLCHRRQDLVAVAIGTEGVSNVIDEETLLQTWSEDWYLTSDRPRGYTPPTPASWHAVIDRAPLSVEIWQAGYQPSIVGASVGDHRLQPELRTRVTVEGWPIYVDGASGLADAFVKAKSRWIDAIYSAGRSMTMKEWIEYTGFQKTKPDWFEPTPLPWAGLAALNAFHKVTWRHLPVPTAAPYDASVRVPTIPRHDEVESAPFR